MSVMVERSLLCGWIQMIDVSGESQHQGWERALLCGWIQVIDVSGESQHQGWERAL